LTDDHKRKILGENHARLHGFDIDTLKAGIVDDEFTYDPANAPFSTTSVHDQVIRSGAKAGAPS
jgi:hypothetical protein